jgi:hypothetical protein
MARHSTHLILVVFLALFLVLALTVGSTTAQNGSCPDWALGQLFPPPPATYPSQLVFCAGGADVTIAFGSQYPCGGGVLWDNQQWPILFDHQKLVLVFPPGQTFPSGSAKFGFTFYTDWAFIGPNQNNQPRISVLSFNSSGVLIGSKQNVELSEFPYSNISLDKQGWYVGDGLGTTALILPAVQGGYFEFYVNFPGPELFNEYMISGWRVYDSHSTAPDLCEIPGFPVPTNTPTPSPSPTPTPSDTPGTMTPTNTPANTATNTHTPWPTAAGGTPTPLATATAYVINTVQAENTPTRYPAVTLPPVIIAPFDVPSLDPIPTAGPFSAGLTPNATTEAQQDEIGDWIEGTQIQATRWYTRTAWGAGDITSTYGFTTPYSIGEGLGTAITSPIAYAKAIGLYMPNLWPIVLFLILAVMWIFFNLAVKYGLAIGSEVFNIILKLWEAIPFVNVLVVAITAAMLMTLPAYAQGVETHTNTDLRYTIAGEIGLCTMQSVTYVATVLIDGEIPQAGYQTSVDISASGATPQTVLAVTDVFGRIGATASLGSANCSGTIFVSFTGGGAITSEEYGYNPINQSGLPIPTPFELPTPNPDLLDTSPLWDYSNLSGTLSAFQTVFELAKQNYVLTAFVVLGVIGLVVWWLSQFVADRGRNI